MYTKDIRIKEILNMSVLAIEELKKRTFTRKCGLESNSSVANTFAFSNENMRQFINLLNIAGGRVATVGSSGDQVFYSVFKDAEEVTLIDGNPYAKPMVELKKSAVMNMSYDEFMRYWSKDFILNKSDTMDLLGDVSVESRKFFEFLFNQIKSTRFDTRSEISKVINLHSFRALLLARKDYNLSHGSEFYDNEPTYNILKSKLKNADIKYITAEFSDFHKELKGEYNSILLSNIWDYVREQTYCDAVVPLINNNLVSNGTMQMHYEMGRYPTMMNNSHLPNDEIDNSRISMYVVQDPSTNFEIFEDKTKQKYVGPYPKRTDTDLVIMDRFEDMVYIYEK